MMAQPAFRQKGKIKKDDGDCATGNEQRFQPGCSNVGNVPNLRHIFAVSNAIFFNIYSSIHLNLTELFAAPPWKADEVFLPPPSDLALPRAWLHTQS